MKAFPSPHLHPRAEFPHSIPAPAACGQRQSSPQPWDERCCRKQRPSFPPLWRELWNRFFSNTLAEQQDGERPGKVPAETWHRWPELPCVPPGEGPLDHGHAVGSRAGWVQKGALWPLPWASHPREEAVGQKKLDLVHSRGWDSNPPTSSSEGPGTEMPMTAEWPRVQGCTLSRWAWH